MGSGSDTVRQLPFIEYRGQIRGLLARIRAIIRRMARSGQNAEDFAALLEGRLGALARVHEILLRAPDVKPDLVELVNGELLAQAIPGERVIVSGPEVLLASAVAGTLALVLHELTVNAIQHGALGIDGGRARVWWHAQGDAGRVRLRWQESAGPVPPREVVPGLGWELITNTLPYEIGAQVALELQGEGLLCVIDFDPQGKMR